MSIITKDNGQTMDAIGLGFFQTDYILYCGDKEIARSFNNSGFNLAFDSYKIYKTINLSEARCQSQYLLLNIYTPTSLKTFGQISNNALAGTTEFIASAKRAIEFLSTGIYLVCSIFLLFWWVTRYFILKDFGDNYSKNQFETDGGWIIVAWALFSLFKSGMADILASTPTSVGILFRIQTAISLLCHTQPSIWISIDSKKRRYQTISILLALYIPFALNNSFNTFLVYTALAANILGIFVSAYKRKAFFFIFSTLAIVEVMKVLNLKFLPAGSTTIAFTTIAYSYLGYEFLKSVGLYASANLWFRRNSKGINSENDLVSIFRSMSEEIDVGKISVLLLGKASDHNLWAYDSSHLNEIEITRVNKVPGPMAQVISTDSPIMHINASSEYSINLLKRSPLEKYGSYFSILPLKSHGEIIGAIALSNYSKSFDESNDFKKEKIETFINVFSECISVVSSNIEKRFEDEMLDRITHLSGQIRNSHFDTMEVLGEYILEALKKDFGWSGFIGNYNEHTQCLDILSSTYADSNGGTYLKGEQWQMSKENVRAPAPVALFYGKTVFVPNVSWITENISDATKRLFVETGINSFVAIPIRNKNETSLVASYLLWISSSRIGVFNTTFERCSTFLQEIIEREHQQIINRKIESNVFSDIIRQDIKKRIISGESPIERAQGTLVMIDLVGSTAISKFLGGEQWKKFQQDFIREIDVAGKSFGLKSELFVWDALYLTLENACISEDDLFNLTNLVIDKASSLNERFKTSHLIKNPYKPVRVCATFGDITREISNGAWAVTGNAMARVCKLEQAIKQKNFIASVTQEILTEWSPSGVKLFKSELEGHDLIAANLISEFP